MLPNMMCVQYSLIDGLSIFKQMTMREREDELHP